MDYAEIGTQVLTLLSSYKDDGQTVDEIHAALPKLSEYLIRSRLQVLLDKGLVTKTKMTLVKNIKGGPRTFKWYPVSQNP